MCNAYRLDGSVDVAYENYNNGKHKTNNVPLQNNITRTFVYKYVCGASVSVGCMCLYANRLLIREQI